MSICFNIIQKMTQHPRPPVSKAIRAPQCQNWGINTPYFAQASIFSAVWVFYHRL